MLHHVTRSSSIVCASLVLLVAASTVTAQDWQQFRGPNCSGMAASAHPLPTEFSSTERVAWSIKLGDGIGCPVVAAGRVFTSAMIDDDTVGLYAFDLKTGRQLWVRTWPAGDLADVHATNSHASTTPAADADHCYFYFSTLGMFALDAQTGADVWHRPLPVPYFVFKWGPGMSPVLFRDMVLFCQDDDLSPMFYALDRRTGEIRWQDDRSDMAVNYSHPVICSGPDGDEIVLAGTGLLIGYNPETGKRLWQARTLLRNIKTTPVCIDGVIYISLQSGGIANQWLASVDRAKTGNGDGKLTRDEMQGFVGDRPIPEAFFVKTFDRGDTNKDGVLEGGELDLAFLHPGNFAGASYDSENPADEYIMAVRGGGRGDVTDTHLLYRKPTKHTDHIVSPLVVDGRMLLVKSGGIATCFDAASGDQLYGPVRIQNEGNYFASPVYGDGKIYIGGENGHVVVLRSAPELEVLAVNNLGDGILGTPAISGGSLVFRTRTSLICIR